MIDPHSIKAAIRKVKDLQYTDIEIKVRDATNNDPWGTSSTLMQEIADATNNPEDYPRLFTILWKRLLDLNHVMHVHKALLLIEYLLRNGSDRFIRDAKHRQKDVQRLKRYKHYDQNNVDDAKDARIKAKKVHDLLSDDKLLQEERAKAEKLRGKKIGISSTRSAHSNHYSAHPSSVEDRYGTISPAEMGIEEPKVLAERAAPGEADPLDDEDDGKGGDDDPFGAPATMTAGDEEEQPVEKPKKKAPKAEKAGQQTVDTEEKKKKKHKKKEKAKTTPSQVEDDPFAEVPEMTPAVQEQPKPTKKATIMAAFDDGPRSTGEVDLLTSVFSEPPKKGTQDWAFGDGPSKGTEKQTDAWDAFDSGKSKPQPQAKTTTATTSDDPWSTDLADLTLGSKGAKPASQPTGGKTMAAMRGTAPPKTVEFTSNPWEDSPFGAQPKSISPTYQQPAFAGPYPTGGFPQGGYPQTGGYPQGGYFMPAPTGYTGYGGGGFAPPQQQPSPFGAFAPPPTTTSTYDPFASLSVSSQPVGVTTASSTSQKKQTSTAFDGLGW